MTKFKQLIEASVIVILLGAGIYLFMGWKSALNLGGLPEFDFAQNLSDAAVNAGDPLSSQDNIYENAYWGFAFGHAGDFQIKEIDEDNGALTVLAEGAGEKRTFQIFIADFDEAGAITPERIKKDLPGVKIEQPQTISFAGTDALAFISPKEEGKMIEVWFIRGGALYQVSSYFEFAGELSKILASWKFL